MDELIKMVVARTGISEPMAKIAVDTVLSFVKTKLPPQFASQLDGLIGGGGPSIGGVDLGSIGGALGGLFDKK